MYTTVAAARRDLDRAFVLEPKLLLSPACMVPTWKGGSTWLCRYKIAVQAAFQKHVVRRVNARDAFYFFSPGLCEGFQLPDVSDDAEVQQVLRKAWPYYLVYLTEKKKHKQVADFCSKLGMTRITPFLMAKRLRSKKDVGSLSKLPVGILEDLGDYITRFKHRQYYVC